MTVGYLLVGLPAGVLVDRLDPWRVLIAMDAARALLFAALYALSAAGVLRIWALFVLGLSAGALCGVLRVRPVVVVKELFAASGLMGANSVLELASQICRSPVPRSWDCWPRPAGLTWPCWLMR